MKRRLSVLHVTSSSGPIAGAERLLSDVARHADRNGWALAFATLAPMGALHEVAANEGWPVYALGVRGMRDVLVATRRLRRIVRQSQPDLVHTHLHHASVLAAAAIRGVPLVHTRHYSDYMVDFGRPWDGLLDAWAAGRMAGIAAVSEEVRTHLVDREGVPFARVQVIPNGVDAEGLGRLPRRRGRALLAKLGLGSGPWVGCAATYHPRKGHADLLGAFAIIARQEPRARLLLIGAGTDGPELRRSVRAAGLDGRVALMGFHSQGPELLSGLDVYVQPSREEGFGMAVLEAMAMALPVVASNVGGLRMTVEHGVTGLRVPAKDPEALADGLLSLLRDPARAAGFGAAGRVRVVERFSMARMLAKYDAWYREVLG